MISKNIQAKVANATVTTLNKKGKGRGVLVKNNLILTAAHCIDFKCDGSMTAIGKYFIEEIKSSEGRKLKVAPYAVEPISDIAVLGALDDQEFYDEVTQFQDFCEKTKPLALCLKTFAWEVEVPVWVYTHKKTWIRGKMVNHSIKKNPSTICFNADENIEGGTSGSPIINEQGELMGVVSTAGGPIGISREGTVPFPFFALPVWLCREITAPDLYSLCYKVTQKQREKLLKRLEERR